MTDLNERIFKILLEVEKLRLDLAREHAEQSIDKPTFVLRRVDRAYNVLMDARRYLAKRRVSGGKA